jgi:hypothetical protein
MVSLWPPGRRGAGGFGCLLSLALFAAALYYGVNIGQVYLRYYQLKDSMRTQARLAPSLQDDVIQRRLTAQADSLLPGRRPQFKITRGGTPRKIIIETVYSDKVELPLFKHTFVMHPRAEERL